MEMAANTINHDFDRSDFGSSEELEEIKEFYE